MKYIISATAIIVTFVSILIMIKCVFIKFDWINFCLSFIYLTCFTALIQCLKTKY